MKITQFATQRERAFTLTISQRKIKEIPLKIVRVIVKKTNRPYFIMVCTLIDHRNDAIKCSKLGSESTRLRLVVPLEF